MFGPTAKYRGLDRDPIDGTPMYWHLHPDGLPTRKGDTPEIVDKALLDQSSVTLYHRSQIFRIPEDLDAYNRVMDWIANGGGTLRSERERETDDGWLVWVSWVDLRGYIPTPRGSAVPAKAPSVRPTVAVGSVTLTSETPLR